ncbi:hypothetical protein N1851_005135 [Merluccius polli]|uniref:Uncharacterized protein n=1 Tax=Merluccius polli TaxID=89951 RepID=A0AA47N6J6_MERPO|nr:hypothetical protein N1851_005135 [Merluccius polli]
MVCIPAAAESRRDRLVCMVEEEEAKQGQQSHRRRASPAARRMGSVRLHGMLTRASVRRPAGQKVNMVAAQGASSSPTEKVGTLFAPPTEFLNSPWEASTPPPDTSQPPMSLTSDLGRFQNPSHSAAPDHLLTALMSTQRAPEDASHSSLDQAGSDRPRTPSQTEPSSGYDIFSAPPAGGGLSRPVVAEGGSVVKEADLFHPFPNNSHFLDRPFQPPSSTQEGQNLSVSNVADQFHVPTQELDIFQTQPKEGAKLFQTLLPKSENGPFQTPLPNGTDIFNNPFSAGNDVYGAPKARSDIFSVLPSSESLSISSNTANPFQPSPDVDQLFQQRPPETQDSLLRPSPWAPTTNQPTDSPDPSLVSNAGSISHPTPTDAAVLTPHSALSINLSELPDIFSPAFVGDFRDPTKRMAPPTSSSPLTALPNRPPDTTLTTPLRSKHGILQPTPFSLALASTATPQQSPTDLPSVSVHLHKSSIDIH